MMTTPPTKTVTPRSRVRAALRTDAGLFVLQLALFLPFTALGATILLLVG